MDVARLVDMEAGLMSPRVFCDSDVYQAEQQQVFGRCWQFLTHESMVPKPGDFVLAYMGEDPVVVVRQNDGSLRAFLNQCRHRGVPVCRAESGQIGAFTCPFHGWTYDRAGQLVHVPKEREYYGSLDKAGSGLKPVTQLAVHKGLVFATWDPDAPPLSEYLGDMAWYMDAFLDAYPGGTEVIGGVHKWVVDCNWKFGAEQFAHDVSHAEHAHTSAIRLPEGAPPLQDRRAIHSMPTNVEYSSRKGHGCAIMDSNGRHLGMAGPVYAAWAESMRDQSIAQLGEARGAIPARSGIYTVFPNFSVFSSSPTIRVWLPRGPDQMEIWSWTLVPAAAPPEVKEALRLSNLRTFSPAGTFEQDDGELWSEIQRVLGGRVAREQTFNYQMGMGTHRHGEGLNPGKTTWMESEEAARGFYQRWADLMSTDSWEALAKLEAAHVARDLAVGAAAE